MSTRPSSLNRPVAAASGLALLAGSMALTGALTAPATAASTALVINEAYVNGGSSGAAYTHKYVELQNRSDTPVDLSGYSLQYRAAGSSGASTGVVPLTGTVAPGGYFTLQGGSNGANGRAVPGVDQASGAMNPGAGGGTITLASVTTAVDPSQAADVVDKLGWGTSNAPEGTAASGNSVTLSLSRAASADTDVNGADFSALTPTPDAVNGGAVDPPTDPPTPTDRTIAEIQGTGAASPLVGSTVTTRGVVTAAFPSGGFDGFYIQAPGPDTTPGASDGVFVHEPGFADTIEVGDSVEVQGVVKEFSTLTEVDADTVTELADPLGRVVPRTVLPGTDCALPGDACLTGAALDAAREAHEGETFLPEAPMTVTDSYDFGATSSSFFGEIGIAADSDIPLVTPTEVVDAQDTPGIAARTAYNAAHLVVLDDGSSATYWNTSNTASAQDQPVPWLTKDHTVRVGAGVTFDEPVVLDYRFGWKLQPQRQVVGAPTGLVTFEQDRPASPARVGGDVRLATFNVLNYFTTFGGDVPGCSAFVDRDDTPIATRTCSAANGPRGAWDRASFERQQAKIVSAINTMDADIVSLEELENSRTVDGVDRDEAISALVSALNRAARSRRWAYVPSPSTLPATEDVIRTGFIYDPATIKPVDESVIYDGPAFDNARDPLAQVFKGRRSRSSQKFAVIVNHFKSKGSGVDDGTGQGNANPDRVAQAQALAGFADEFAADHGTDRVFLTGDFNAYSMEDPVQVLEAAGFRSLESTDDPDEESYSFGGTSGSLDHVFANAAARALVTGVDVWEVNANESVFYQYSRYNYIGTDLYSTGPFAASDHNPEVVGLRLERRGHSGPGGHHHGGHHHGGHHGGHGGHGGHH